MRVVYGAGAVAAVSVMAVGLFKPDFGATADQLVNQGDTPTTDSQAPNEALVTQESRDGGRRDRDTRRVVRYVYLSPGERVPRGAEVISAEEAARRLGTAPGTRASSQRSNNEREPNRSRQPAANPDRATNDNQNNEPAANPRPPAPPVTTRQSGG